MKNKRASGSLFGLLARQYLLFSVTLLAIAAVALVHVWKGNVLLSIAGGTVLYMVLVQVVFA